MLTSRNDCSGPRPTWRQIFKQSCLLIECRATLDGPDRWSSGWLVNGPHVPTSLWRQQGGGGVMFWTGNMERELVGPFRVPEGVKMTLAKYIKFLTDHFLSWYKKMNRAFRSKIIFMHDNTPSQAAKNTSLAVIGCYRHKRRETHCVATILPWISTLLRTFGASSSKRSMRVGGSLHQNSSSGRIFWHPAKKFKQKLSKNSQVQNCEGDIKEWVLC